MAQKKLKEPEPYYDKKWKMWCITNLYKGKYHIWAGGETEEEARKRYKEVIKNLDEMGDYVEYKAKG